MSALPWWVWLLVGVALGALLARSGRRFGQPLARPSLRLADLARNLDGFFLRMAPGAVFHLSREGAPGFLQLVLVRRGPSGEAVELGLPEVEWSVPYLAEAYRALRGAGYTCRLETKAQSGGPRFLRARLEGTRPELVPASARLLERVAAVLGFAPEDTYTLRVWAPSVPSTRWSWSRRSRQHPEADAWRASSSAGCGATWIGHAECRVLVLPPNTSLNGDKGPAMFWCIRQGWRSAFRACVWVVGRLS